MGKDISARACKSKQKNKAYAYLYTKATKKAVYSLI